ncbi:adhesion G protein-coupled receptor B2 [Trichonephila clavipes]|nr:adhesion G protein-coupled receptor B2 [Trichonephila clavipes]
MSYDSVACKRSLDGLFGLGVFGRIKLLAWRSIVRALCPPSKEETGRQNYLRRLVYQQNGAAQKRDTNSGYRTLNCNKTTMYYSIDMNFFYTKENLVALHFKYDFWHMTATAGSDVVQSGRPIFDDFFQHLWPYIGNNTANVVFQMVKRLWLIRIDQ